MPGSHVDVNLHPTKQEVGFLHQDELLEAIREAVEELLLSSNDKSEVLLTFVYTIMPIPSCLYHHALPYWQTVGATTVAMNIIIHNTAIITLSSLTTTRLAGSMGLLS